LVLLLSAAGGVEAECHSDPPTLLYVEVLNTSIDVTDGVANFSILFVVEDDDLILAEFRMNGVSLNYQQFYAYGPLPYSGYTPYPRNFTYLAFGQVIPESAAGIYNLTQVVLVDAVGNEAIYIPATMPRTEHGNLQFFVTDPYSYVAPSFLDYTFLPYTYNVTESSITTYVTSSISFNIAGFNKALVRYYLNGNTSLPYVFQFEILAKHKQTSTDPGRALYISPVTLTRGMISGTYIFTEAILYGYSTVSAISPHIYNRDDMITLGFSTTFGINGISDEQPPIIDTILVFPSFVNTSISARTISVHMVIHDDFGVKNAVFYTNVTRLIPGTSIDPEIGGMTQARLQTGLQVLTNQGHSAPFVPILPLQPYTYTLDSSNLVSGDSFNGEYEVIIGFGRGTPASTWNFIGQDSGMSIAVYDFAGNSRNYYFNDVEQLVDGQSTIVIVCDDPLPPIQSNSLGNEPQIGLIVGLTLGSLVLVSVASFLLYRHYVRKGKTDEAAFLLVNRKNEPLPSSHSQL